MPRSVRGCDRYLERDRQKRAQRNKVYGYHRANWQRVRKARLELAEYRCELRLSGCTDFAKIVHLNPALHGNHDAATLTDWPRSLPAGRLEQLALSSRLYERRLAHPCIVHRGGEHFKQRDLPQTPASSCVPQRG